MRSPNEKAKSEASAEVNDMQEETTPGIDADPTDESEKPKPDKVSQPQDSPEKVVSEEAASNEAEAEEEKDSDALKDILEGAQIEEKNEFASWATMQR